jgi:acetyl-CoA carboxylase biotin carboxyl carrier protein
VTTTPVTVPAYTPPAPVPTPIVDTPAVKVEKTTDKTPPPADSSKKLVEIKSPMVGTFYRSPAPEKPVYINIGDTISKGKVVCIIEAMKLFNEIESDISGKIVKVLVDDSSPVEYDQPLFLVEVQ